MRIFWHVVGWFAVICSPRNSDLNPQVKSDFSFSTVLGKAGSFHPWLLLALLFGDNTLHFVKDNVTSR